MTDTLKTIESLARKVAENAATAGTKLSEQMEALKVLSPYYAALKKSADKGGEDEPDDDTPTMADMQDKLRLVERIENGSGEVSRSSRRRN